MKSIHSLELNDKVVLLRLNLNVPIEGGHILDDFRLRAVMPTVEFCKEHAKKTVIIAHLGRPNGPNIEDSLRPIAAHLQKLLGSEVLFFKDCIGEKIRERIEEAHDGSVILLENVRFHEEEVKNDQSFGAELAKNGNVFINDAFGDSAKAAASVIWPAKILPSAAGFRLLEEIEQLSHIKNEPREPFTLIVGGVKITEKLGAVKELGKKADQILVGGAMANTFFLAQGKPIGTSKIQEEELGLAKSLLEEFGDKLVLPVDVGVARKTGGEFQKESYRFIPIEDLDPEEAILDIGVQTMDLFEDYLARSQTIFWAGPVGMIEWDLSAKHSIEIAHLLAGYANDTFVGGGETASVLKMAGVEDQIDFISTGGSASLQFLAGEELPGLRGLQQS